MRTRVTSLVLWMMVCLGCGPSAPPPSIGGSGSVGGTTDLRTVEAITKASQDVYNATQAKMRALFGFPDARSKYKADEFSGRSCGS
jgi:hypothetical protein